MANHPGPEALGLAADIIDQLVFLFFFFVFDKFHLDKFVFFQSGIDGGDDFGRQTVFTDKNQWFQTMGKASEVFVLLAGKLVWHGSMVSRLWYGAACVRLGWSARRVKKMLPERIPCNMWIAGQRCYRR